jgi:hypothetical protein
VPISSSSTYVKCTSFRPAWRLMSPPLLTACTGACTTQVKWLPFLLQPALPKGGVDKRTYYKQKFGPRVFSAMENLKNVGADGVLIATIWTICVICVAPMAWCCSTGLTYCPR